MNPYIAFAGPVEHFSRTAVSSSQVARRSDDDTFFDEEPVDNRLDQLAAEFVERTRNGDRPTIAEYATRFPELADEIRDLFPTVAKIEGLKVQFEKEQQPFVGRGLVAGNVPLSQLGDFRIIRVIGRGGMGVVHESEQMSLGRRGAIKALPLLSVAQPNQEDSVTKAGDTVNPAANDVMKTRAAAGMHERVAAESQDTARRSGDDISITISESHSAAWILWKMPWLACCRLKSVLIRPPRNGRIRLMSLTVPRLFSNIETSPSSDCCWCSRCFDRCLFRLIESKALSLGSQAHAGWPEPVSGSVFRPSGDVDSHGWLFLLAVSAGCMSRRFCCPVRASMPHQK